MLRVFLCLTLAACSATDWAQVGRAVVPDEAGVQLDPETGQALYGLTWYVGGPREVELVGPRPLPVVPVLPEGGDDGKATGPDAPDFDVPAFTDPHTGEVWVRPSWLFGGAGLALLLGIWALIQRLRMGGASNAAD